MYYAPIMIDKLSTPPSPHSFDWTGFFIWFLLNIVLSLLPLILGFAMLAFMVEWQVRGRHYLNLLKDGQLYFFSTTLAATLISKLLTLLQPLLKDPAKATEASGVITLIIAFVIILIVAAFFFGATMRSALMPSSADAFMLLQIVQFRLNRLEDRCNARGISIPLARQNRIKNELRNIRNDQLKDMEDQCNNAKGLADDIEKQLSGQPRRNRGTRDGTLGQASISILLAITASTLGTIVFSIYGGV